MSGRACALAVVTLALAWSGAAQAMLRRGDVVVAQPHGLVRLDPATGVMVDLHVTPRPTFPAGLVVLPDGDLLVADYLAPFPDPQSGTDDGTVLRIDLRTRRATRLTPPGVLVNPIDLLLGPGGRVVLADIDAGSHEFRTHGKLFRRGVLFDLDPATGTVTPLVSDCCEWNPMRVLFVGPDEVLVADAGCCAYEGPGQIVRANLATGGWAPIATDVSWRDPFGLALSPGSATLWVAESAFAEPGPPAVRGIDLASGVTSTLVEGAPLVEPSGLLLEADGHMLIADQGAGAVFRMDTTDGETVVVAQGPPLEAPNSLAPFDAGDTIGGTPTTDPIATGCASRAIRAEAGLVRDALRCIATRSDADLESCLLRAVGHMRARPLSPSCPECLRVNHWWVAEEIPPALARTPGSRLACAGTDRRCRTSLARAAARLHRDLGRCNGAYLGAATPDRGALAECRAHAVEGYERGTHDRRPCASCTVADRDAIGAEIGSLVDGTAGAWFCGP